MSAVTAPLRAVPSPSADPSNPASSEPGFQRMLFLCHYPPSTAAGAPIIVKQVLRAYDMERLDVVCSSEWAENQTDVIAKSFLPCRHTIVPSAKRRDWRPRRLFVPILDTVDALRLRQIMDVGRKIIRERGIETIFTAPYGCEFTLAAYHLSREFNLPLTLFESDDWSATASNQHFLPRRLARKYHAPLIRHVTNLYLTSPAMVRAYEERFGRRGEFLFHFIDPEIYQQAARENTPPTDKIRIVYTGSINNMFEETMLWFSQILNRGVSIGGKTVEMTIHTGSDATPYLGPHVHQGAYVRLEEIPGVLANAHLLVILVSFTEEPTIRRMIRTSLYTKTIDYLASGRPVLVVSPRDSSEVDYFGDVTCVVDSPDESQVLSAIQRCLEDTEYASDLRERGLALVRDRHSMAALERIFLSKFRVKTGEKVSNGTPSL